MMSIIEKYFPHLSNAQFAALQQLPELYSYWNERINVISRKDIENLGERHILHSLSISRLVHFKKGSQILDIGTGGGFPGIPLAIMFPEVHFHLIDGIGKKIHVVNEIASALKLENLTAQQIRAEELKKKYDFIVSRAVTALEPFYQYSKPRISGISHNSIPNGILYLKGGNVEEELMFPHQHHSIYRLSDWFEEEFFDSKLLIHLF